METSAWYLMEAVSGQTGITVSCIQHITQVYLKKNTIRIIIARILYNFFSEPKLIDKIIIVFIHSWLISMVTDERESNMLHHDMWLLRTFWQPQILMIF